jgi:hypothetical protein
MKGFFAIEQIHGERPGSNLIPKWKAIEGFEGFEVSDGGSVRSLTRQILCKNGVVKTIRGKDVPSFPNKDRGGYHYVSISKNNKTFCLSVHRLVAKAFIFNPEGKPEVNHKDFDTANNWVGNLEWATELENMLHAAEGGKMARLLSIGTARQIKVAIQEGVGRSAAALQFGISKSLYEKIRRGEVWRWL